MVSKIELKSKYVSIGKKKSIGDRKGVAAPFDCIYSPSNFKLQGSDDLYEDIVKVTSNNFY